VEIGNAFLELAENACDRIDIGRKRRKIAGTLEPVVRPDIDMVQFVHRLSVFCSF